MLFSQGPPPQLHEAAPDPSHVRMSKIGNWRDVGGITDASSCQALMIVQQYAANEMRRVAI
jgi:hypothetical protein